MGSTGKQKKEYASVYRQWTALAVQATAVLHPTRSVHIRCVDSGWRSRGRVRASERSEQVFEPGGMQRIKQSKGNHWTVAA